MTNGSHTPGPWTWRDERIPNSDLGGINIEYGPDENPEVIATLARCRFEGDEVADGRLIASAPDLLYAAKLALQLCEEAGLDNTVSRSLDIVRDAIAKATGR